MVEPTRKCIWIRVESFESVALEVSIDNTTTSTSVEVGSVIELCEIEDNSCLVRLPKKSCSQGHFLAIQIRSKISKPLTPPDMWASSPALHITAKVVSMEELDEISSIATLKFIQFDKKEWALFVASFSNRQNEITNLVKKVQG